MPLGPLLATTFSHDGAGVSIYNAWRNVAAALGPNEEMVALSKEIRQTTGGKACIFGAFDV